jgi:glycosyltransferase involved in cell wall biosynthesis
MKQRADLVIVMPVGPAANPEFIRDSLSSIEHYITVPYRIILADDSQKGLGHEIQKYFPAVEIVPARKNLGKVAGLYINLSHAYKYALDKYDFTALLKMDDDALITGNDPQAAAIRVFKEYPLAGMAGRHITRQFSADGLGHVHDNYWPRKQLLKDTCSWKIIRRPVANLTLRKLFFKAVRNGYEIGENIQGGAYFMSAACLARLEEAGHLPNYNLKNVNFGEDLMFSLLVRAIGFQLVDLSGNDLPFGIAWKGLPASPETLHQKNKKIIHSTRSWQNMGEKEIRNYFQQIRISQ